MAPEEVQRVAEPLLPVEVAHVEDHHDAEAEQRGDGSDEPRVAAETADDPRALASERPAEHRRRGRCLPRRRDAAHRSASIAARKARPRAAESVNISKL